MNVEFCSSCDSLVLNACVITSAVSLSSAGKRVKRRILSTNFSSKAVLPKWCLGLTLYESRMYSCLRAWVGHHSSNEIKSNARSGFKLPGPGLKFYRARSRLYRSQILQVNTKHSLETGTRKLSENEHKEEKNNNYFNGVSKKKYPYRSGIRKFNW